MAACGTVRRIRPPPASETSRLRCPLEPSRPPSGCDSSRSFGERRLLVALLDADFDGVAADSQAGIADLGVAQHAADLVAHLIELFLLHVVGIDFEQQVGTALQIEAEHDVALRPDRPGLHLGFGEEIRNGEQADDERGHE